MGIMYDYMTEENYSKEVDINAQGFSNKLDGLIRNLMTEFEEVGVPEGTKSARYASLTEPLKDIETLLADRFGLNIKILYSESLAYVIPFTGSNSSTVDPGRHLIALMVDELNKGVNEKEVNFKGHDDSKLDGFIISKLNKDMRDMNKLYSGGKISVDGENLKIHGVIGTDLITPIGVNFGFLMDKGMDERDIASIILHEVGHQFNVIQNANNLVETSLAPLMSLTDSKISNHKKKQIIMKAFGDEIGNDENKLDTLPFKLMDKLSLSSSNNTSFFNSEIMADNFSVRLGYGANVSLSLIQAFPEMEGERESPLTSLFALLMSVILVVISVVSSSFIGIILLFPIFVSTILIMLANSSGLNTMDEHEQSYARTRRAKLGVIRMIRTQKKLPKSAKLMIEDVIKLDNTLISLAQEKGVMNNVIALLSGKSSEIAHHELYQRTEQLMENDLHVHAFKRS